MPASETAQFAAAHRAYHFINDRPVILEDSAAIWLLNPQLSTILRVSPLRWLFWRPLILKVRPISAFIIIRSRYAEEMLENAIRNDCRQYVIMGAGLDSWALRHKDSKVKVFELDLPATQQYKKTRIQSYLGGLPSNLVMVPMDFESESVLEVLQNSEIKIQTKVFVSWLGTICYLSRNSIAETFSSLSSICVPGSRIVFDYFQPKSTMSPADLQLFELLDEGGKRRGEPMQTLMETKEINEILQSSGFNIIEDLSASQIRQRYLDQRSDGLDIPGFVRLCCAEK
jgi:methyltransferase (TIGR00027 family)